MQAIDKYLENIAQMMQETTKTLQETGQMMRENEQKMRENQQMLRENQQMLRENQAMMKETREITQQITEREAAFKIEIQAFRKDLADKEAIWKKEREEQKAALDKKLAAQKAALDKEAAQRAAIRAQEEQAHDAKWRKEMDELKASMKETDRKLKVAQDLFTSQWGKLVESLVEGDLVKILREQGLEVRDTTTRRKGTYQGDNYEFDIIAHNGDEIVIVEVKTTLRVKNVQHFVEKLKKARTWLKEYAHYKVYGAMAYLRAEESSDRLAMNENLFVIRATGNSAAIINPEGFIPRAF